MRFEPYIDTNTHGTTHLQWVFYYFYMQATNNAIKIITDTLNTQTAINQCM